MAIINLRDEPRHLQTLAEWHQGEWAHLNPGETLAMRIARMQHYLSVDLVPSTFVYTHNGNALGSAALVASDMDTRPGLTPWLASVFVAPPFRRQGIGSALVRHAMRQAEAAGISRLYLFTPDRAGFYQDLGWQTMSVDDYRDQAVTLMQVDLLSA